MGKKGKSHRIALAVESRLAEVIIKLVSFGVILSVLGIFFNLFWVVWPLFKESSYKITARLSLLASNPKQNPNNTQGELVKPIFRFIDKQDLGYIIEPSGALELISLESGKVLQTQNFGGQSTLLYVDQSQGPSFTLYYANGEARWVELNTEAKFEAKQSFRFDPKTFAFGAVRKLDDSHRQYLLTKDGKLEVHSITETTDFTGTKKRAEEFNYGQISLKNPTYFSVSQDGNTLILANADGIMELWQLKGGALSQYGSEQVSMAPIKNLAFLYGNETYLVQTAEALHLIIKKQRSSSSGTQKPVEKFTQRLQIPLSGQNLLAPAALDRSVAIANSQTVDFYNSSTGQKLMQIPLEAPLSALVLRSDFKKLAFLDSKNQLKIIDFHIAFPEISFTTYFKKVFYEGYTKPEYIWQSSSAQEDYEVKLSLVPLIIGSLKASLYAILFSFPLAMFGAVYLSQFARPKIRSYCKPLIEIISTIPSVIIGLLAALWLGPYFQKYFLHILVCLALFPLLFWVFFLGFQHLKKISQSHFWEGREFLLSLLPCVVAIILGYTLGNYLNQHWFGGSFVHNLYERWHIKYDQQNTITTALALGFATIPIIFTITDDALRSVPESLRAASLALGASKWQTVLKVIIPSASTGLFAALMLGLARTVGETMIVLMASGNTPVVDFNLFNGMRTLSANIAVEIVEAPVNGYLYRTLFLSGLLLFLFTFVLNFAAEAVRVRLKKKFRT